MLFLSPAEHKHVEVVHLFQTLARLVYVLYRQRAIKKKDRKHCFGDRGKKKVRMLWQPCLSLYPPFMTHMHTTTYTHKSYKAT